MELIDIKRCSTCKQYKSLCYFYNRCPTNGRYADGKTYRCKECLKGSHISWKQKNKEHVSNYNMLYRQNNIEKIKSYYKLTDEQKKNNKIIRRKKYFDKFVGLVHNNDGVCLGTFDDYKTAHSNICVKCADGHKWCCSWNNLNSGKWCPVCKTYLGELVSFNSCEYLFDTNFKKIRPHWLLSSNQTRLELDMYNKQLNLAIEYNGIQHYKHVPFFHRTYKEFLKRLDYDKQKIKLCKEQNVKLIVIPYTVKTCDICQYISTEANKLGILTTNNHKEFDLSKIRCSSSKKNKIESIIESKNGVLIEGPFLSRDCNVTLKCEDGHVWTKKNKIESIIESKNGVLIEGLFLSRDSNVTIKCEYGHVWTTKNKYIMKGSWCNICGLTVKQKTKVKISTSLQNFYESDKGKETTKRCHEKRSITMKIQKDKFRLRLTSIKCSGACGEIKPLDSFCKKATAKSGYQSWCKKCTNDYKRKWRSQLRNDKQEHNCPYCVKKYKLKDSMTRHIKENH